MAKLVLKLFKLSKFGIADYMRQLIQNREVTTVLCTCWKNTNSSLIGPGKRSSELLEQPERMKVKIKTASDQDVHTAGAYPAFRCRKRLGIFLLTPGLDASPWQGSSPVLNSPVRIYTPGWKE